MTEEFDGMLDLLDGVPHGDVLFFMACSDRKADPGLFQVPLRELYHGPTWQTLRVHGGHVSDSQIVVLSGKYGWTGAGQHSAAYNERISPQKVDRLIERGANVQERNSKGIVIGWTPVQLIARPHGADPWKAVVVCGGELYRRAFDAVIPELKDLGCIEADAPVIATVGGIGDQRSQLGRILRCIEPEPAPAPRF